MKKILFIASIFLANVAQAQIPHWLPSDKLAGWYPFSGNAADSSPNGNHATIVNNATLVSDRFGNTNNAYEFNGYSSYIEVPDNPSLHARKITMSVWIYRTSTKYGGIINKANRTNAYNEVYGINTRESSLKLNSNCLPGVGWEKTLYNKSLDQNRWLHIVTTWDGDTIRNYINDTLDSKRAVKGLVDSCVGGNLIFGYHWDGFPNDGFQGKIDNISIYTRALSPCEIHRLYRQNHTGIITQPVDTKAIAGNAQFTITTSGSNLSYQWQEQKANGAFLDISNGGSYSGAGTGTLSITAAGINLGGNKYRCIVTATGLCPDTSNAAMLEVPNHINDLSKTGIAIYPNPATAKMIITSEALKPGMKYLITDKFGRSVLNGIISGTETQVSIDMLPPGLYFLRIEGTSMTARMEKL